MSQPAVHSETPANQLPFPFDQRQLMAGWNLLFLEPGAYRDEPTRNQQWNRGAYLAEGLGHCSACHSPRNALGAEKSGSAHFAGGEAEGWTAPALNASSPAPIAWSEEALYAYLRHGYSAYHGVASGPMAPVVGEGLAKQSDEDLRALAHYLASYAAAPAGKPISNRRNASTGRATAACNRPAAAARACSPGPAWPATMTATDRASSACVHPWR